MSALTLVRHAPTAANIADVFMGSQDVPASIEGLKIATANAFDEGVYQRVFSSSLSRASSTAEALFPYARVELDGRLRERGLGLWEGMPKKDVRSQYPDAYTIEGHLDPRYTPPQGESLDEFSARIRAFMTDARHLECVVVTHNGWIRTALWLLGHYPVDQIFAVSTPYLTPLKVPLNHFVLTS